MYYSISLFYFERVSGNNRHRSHPFMRLFHFIATFKPKSIFLVQVCLAPADESKRQKFKSISLLKADFEHFLGDFPVKVVLISFKRQRTSYGQGRICGARGPRPSLGPHAGVTYLAILKSIFSWTDFCSTISLDLQLKLQTCLHSSQKLMEMRSFLGIYSSFVHFRSSLR